MDRKRERVCVGGIGEREREKRERVNELVQCNWSFLELVTIQQ